jgi:methylated-DNA-[protein]-cysteine S-methyltransferase
VSVIQAAIQVKMNSKIGPMYLVASDKGLHGVFWKETATPYRNKQHHGRAVEILDEAQTQLEQYLDGQRKSFDLPLDVQGTSFQKQVWNELSKIPYGKTYSYSDIAKKIKNDKAVRAVGTANGRNPLSLIVPCHRVIAADGTLGGYAGGLSIKEKLLRLEQTGSL